MSEYDMSIHHNPDAKAWTEFFMKTKADNNLTLSDIDESLMVGWFANSMMAMHDHLHNTKIEQLQRENDALRAERKEIEAAAVEKFKDWYKQNNGIAFGQVKFAAEKYCKNLRQQGGE